MKLKVTMTALVEVKKEDFLLWIDDPEITGSELDDELRDRCSTVGEYAELLEAGCIEEVKSNFEISLPLNETEVATLLQEIP